MFCTYFWYLAYAISDCATNGGGETAYQFGTFRTFWGSSNVPIPKGLGYWRRIEATTPEELAVTMIKGVKLMVWCFLLNVVLGHYFVLCNKLGLPPLTHCVEAFSSGKPLPAFTNMASLVADSLGGLLALSTWGHTVIATCRMAGFRALRNTYAPLSSKTIAEYWNRYFYYYKELLVDMFFYPTLIRCFKRNATVRIVFATFMAAGFGNALFHFLRDIHIVAMQGLSRAVLNYPYTTYSLVLALGISISQLRSRQPRRQRGWLHRRIWTPICVFGFFCLLHLLEVTSASVCLHYAAYLLTGG